MAHRKMTAAVVSQEALAADIYSMWMEAEEIAKEAKPGQFISVYSRDGARLLRAPSASARSIRKTDACASSTASPGRARRSFPLIRPATRWRSWGL